MVPLPWWLNGLVLVIGAGIGLLEARRIRRNDGGLSDALEHARYIYGAPVLLVLGASVELASPGGTRVVPLDAFYVNDGVRNTVLADDEVLTRILVPRPASNRRVAFQKLRVRGSIDFPMLNLALAFDLHDGVLSSPDLVVSAIAARPRRIKRLPEGPLDDTLVQGFCDRAFQTIRPLTNINGDVTWRREMVPFLLRKAFAATTA